MEITAGLDWISITQKNGTSVRHPALESKYTERARGVNGYTVCIEYLDGRIEGHNPQRSDMGVHVIYAGQTLTTIGQMGVTALELGLWHLNQGHKITRVDPYIDVWNSGLSISELNDAVEKNEHQSFSRDVIHIKETLGNGETLYFSRGKPKSMRIYNKAAEQNIEGDWIRIECEFKSPHANGVMRSITTSENPQKAIQGHLKRFVDFPKHETYQQIIGSNYAVMETHRHVTGNTRQWLLGVVCSAIANLMLKGDETILDDMHKVVGYKLLEKKSKLKTK